MATSKYRRAHSAKCIRLRPALREYGGQIAPAYAKASSRQARRKGRKQKTHSFSREWLKKTQ